VSSATVRRLATINHQKQSQLNARKFSNIDLFDKKELAEEERKYNDNEDFTTFLKPQA
jgi:hypothetical protein